MPTYEYQCAQCGLLEVFQSMKDDPLTTCPKCKKKKIQRQISGGAGVIFKGSGFYETDYNRSKSYTEAAKADSKPADSKDSTSAGKADSSSASSAKTESKPAKKAKD